MRHGPFHKICLPVPAVSTNENRRVRPHANPCRPRILFLKVRAVPWRPRPKQITGTPSTAFVFERSSISRTAGAITRRNTPNTMSEKDIARQILRSYVAREIDLENRLNEM